MLASMKVFVPMGDEIFDNPELLAELIPYQAGYPILGLKRQKDQLPDKYSTMRSPGSSPSSEALPALSSRTYRAGPALG